MTEDQIIELEEQFIVESESAFAAAYRQAHASGYDVVISQDDSLYRIKSDGSRLFIKHISEDT